ncbi:hypothetical protein BaRGS_00031141, partial [Batillaria attramentaria]
VAITLGQSRDTKFVVCTHEQWRTDTPILNASQPVRIAVASRMSAKETRGKLQGHFGFKFYFALGVLVTTLFFACIPSDFERHVADIVKRFTHATRVQTAANGLKIVDGIYSEPGHKFDRNFVQATMTYVEETADSQPFCTKVETDRFDCWPEGKDASREKCLARGCCWEPSLEKAPLCFYPDDYVSYVVTNMSTSQSGITATLARQLASPYPNDVVQLQVDVTYETQSRLRIKIFDPNIQRFEVPLNLTKKPFNGDEQARSYSVSLQTKPFGILVTRTSNGETIFDSRNMAPLAFADQFLQIGTRLSSPNIYGLGEHRHPLLLNVNWTRLVLWTKDAGPPGGGNLYGAHPFYLNLENDGQAHGVFLLNSNAMEVALHPYGGAQGALTYRVLGGILDFYVFTGPTPVDVIEQYVSLIGKPKMPPFWALGFYLCKYGYMNSTELRKVIDRNRAIQIPYEGQFHDIDYMHELMDYTYDHSRYTDLPEIVNDLHQHEQKYLMIIDPGISITQPVGTYPPFDDGKAMDIFIKNSSGQTLIGKVWPGFTAFPDFFHPKDMNEPSSFINGSTLGCTNSSLDNPPFTPPEINGGSLISRTVCPSAQQAVSSHYNLHNMYGWSETKLTAACLQKLLGKRSMVLSRSTFPSSGRYGRILNFNMFGVNMVGTEVCGFTGNTTRELCIRWMQLGSFYPFMRNHADLHSQPQDPAVFDATAVSYMKTTLQTRYRLLPYMYTRFYIGHTAGTPVVQPLFALGTEAIDKQFMWGSELLISPVLQKGATSVEAYIPEGVWYDFHNGTQLRAKSKDYVVLPAPLSTINVHIRGGSILPLLPPALTTTAARRQSFELLVVPDENMTASGLLFWDDGESLDSIDNGEYTLTEFFLNGPTLKTNVLRAAFTATLDTIQVLGVTSKPGAVYFDGKTVAYSYDDQAM